MSSVGRATWTAAVAALAAQAVVLVVTAVDTAHHAATVDAEKEATNLGEGVFLGLFGSLVYTIGAILLGLGALLLVIALGLSVRPGAGRLTGLVTGLALQVPVQFTAVRILAEAAEPRPVIVVVGGAVVVLAALVPATWRWVRRPPAVRADTVVADSG